MMPEVFVRVVFDIAGGKESCDMQILISWDLNFCTYAYL